MMMNIKQRKIKINLQLNLTCNISNDGCKFRIRNFAFRRKVKMTATCNLREPLVNIWKNKEKKKREAKKREKY